MKLLLSPGAIVGIVAGVAVVIVIAIAIWYISAHNKLVRMRNRFEEAWATIDVYLKKRFDLIPNLLETVKGYANYESDTLVKVTEARNRYASAVTYAEKIQADKSLSRAVRGFNVVMEKYPDLKANVNFLDLQNQLKAIESELVQARKYYNATVREFNTIKETFPSSIVANRMKLENQPYFELDSEEERQNVKISF